MLNRNKTLLRLSGPVSRRSDVFHELAAWHGSAVQLTSFGSSALLVLASLFFWTILHRFWTASRFLSNRFQSCHVFLQQLQGALVVGGRSRVLLQNETRGEFYWGDQNQQKMWDSDRLSGLEATWIQSFLAPLPPHSGTWISSFFLLNPGRMLVMLSLVEGRVNTH